MGHQEEQPIPPLGIALEVCQLGPRPEPPGGDVAVEVWRDVEGAVCARSYVKNGCAWVEVPGAGLYRFGLKSRKTSAYPDQHASTDLVTDTYQRVALPISLTYCGYEVLHASAVLTEDGVVGFCAASGTGKSTLVAALCREGYVGFADDALVLDFETRRPDIGAVCLPFSIRLKEHNGVRRLEAGEQCMGMGAPLAALCILERAPTSAESPEVACLPPMEAFSALLPHTYHMSLGELEEKRAVLARYLELVARVRVYRVKFAADLGELPRLIRAVEAKVAPARPGAHRQWPSFVNS